MAVVHSAEVAAEEVVDASIDFNSDVCNWRKDPGLESEFLCESPPVFLCW